jgi:hypothetical protein
MAIRIDGSDNLTRTTSIPSTTAFTMMAWFYPVTLGSFGGILGMAESSSDFFSLMHVGTTYSIFNGSTNANGSTLATGTWYHGALTCSGTGAGQLLGYLNGVLDITHAGNSSVVATQLELGFNSGTDQFDGRFSAVKIYSAVLTESEIAMEMRQYVPVRTADLNTWSPCRSSAEATANYGGAGGVWTASGTLTTENGPPIPWRVSPYPQILISTAGEATQLVTVVPSLMKWQAQARTLTRAFVLTPGRQQWQGRTLALRRTIPLLASRMQWQRQVPVLQRTMTLFASKMMWQAQLVRTGGLTIIAPARLRWQAQAGVVQRGGVSGGRRGYFLGMQRGYPRRQAVLV